MLSHGKDLNNWKLKHELAVVAVILTAFLLACYFVTLKVTPIWLDEVTVADPAINFVLGNGFVSTGWQYQPKEEFWASNAPLHQFLLVGWLELWGVSPVVARSINYFYAIIMGLLIWGACKRSGLVKTSISRVCLLFSILGAAGVSTNYVSGRYDPIGMLLVSMLFFLFTYPDSLKKWLTVLCVSMFLPIAGINLLPYCFLVIGLLFFFTPKKTLLRFSFTMGIGIFIGLSVLLAIYYYNGVMGRILESAGGHGLSGAVGESAGGVQAGGVGDKVNWVISNIGIIIENRFQNLTQWYLINRSYLILLAGMCYCIFMAWRSPSKNKIIVMALFAVFVPLVMGGLRNYPFYYTWMAVIPMAILFYATLSEIPKHHTLFVAIIFSVVIVYPGYGRYFIKSLVNGNSLKDSYYISFEEIKSELKQDDKVYASFSAYYPTVQTVDYVLLPTYKDMLTAKEKSEVNVLIVPAEKFEQEKALFGGDWKLIKTSNLQHPYNLSIYRKI